MIVGTCQIELDMPGIRSLKQKRSCLRGLTAQLHKKFNVAAAEVALHDVWQSSTLGVSAVSTSSDHAEQVLDSVLRWIEHYRPDVTIVDYHMESIHL